MVEIAFRFMGPALAANDFVSAHQIAADNLWSVGDLSIAGRIAVTSGFSLSLDATESTNAVESVISEFVALNNDWLR